MDLSALIKHLRKNIVLIIIVVLCCATLASVFKIITNYSDYRKEEENMLVCRLNWILWFPQGRLSKTGLISKG